MATDVSEEHIASIFRVGEISSARKQVASRAYSSTLNMKAICFSERSVATQRTTRRRIPEDDTLQINIIIVTTLDHDRLLPIRSVASCRYTLHILKLREGKASHELTYRL
jgi:hypothetical protein